MKVSEPVIAYNTSDLQGLKKRLISVIENINDKETLQECLDILYEREMPGIYTDEEFAEELFLSESGGNATKAEVNAFFAKWGY